MHILARNLWLFLATKNIASPSETHSEKPAGNLLAFESLVWILFGFRTRFGTKNNTWEGNKMKIATGRKEGRVCVFLYVDLFGEGVSQLWQF